MSDETQPIRTVRPSSTADARCLIPAVYNQLLAVARKRMTLERSAGAGHTLQPTAVVHEAFARLAKSSTESWQGEREFFLAATREMERVLIDHARAKFASKRGGDPKAPERGGVSRVPLDVVELASEEDGVGTLALQDALLRLEKEDEQAAMVIRLRFFAGLSIPEVALALGISERTVVREWTFARAFLAAEMTGDHEQDSLQNLTSHQASSNRQSAEAP